MFREVPSIARGPSEFDLRLLFQVPQVTLNGSQRKFQCRSDHIRPAAGGLGNIPKDPFCCAIYCAIYCANFLPAMLFQCPEDLLQHKVNERSGICDGGTFIDSGVILPLIVVDHRFHGKILKDRAGKGHQVGFISSFSTQRAGMYSLFSPFRACILKKT